MLLPRGACRRQPTLPVEDFSECRMANDEVQKPVNTGRRRFLTASTVVVGAVGAGFAAVPFIKSWNPSARAKLAGAPVTADISALQEGQRLILEWRGQPIWIVKRSKAVLDALPTWTAACATRSRRTRTSSRPTCSRPTRSCARSSPRFRCWSACAPTWAARLKWPRRDPPRAVRPGVEGRLLLPLPQVALRHGRARVPGVPAPTNLVVPPHYYADDSTIVVGVDPQGA